MNENDNTIIKRRGPDRALWYIVAHAADMAVAEIPAGLLRSAGIPVYLFREAAGSSAIPLSVGLLGGVDIGVPESYYDEASALLEQDDGDEIVGDEFDDDELLGDGDEFDDEGDEWDEWDDDTPELEPGDEEP